jgi:hypothetical protein
MVDRSEYKENSNAVQAHLGIMQSIIQRMASNSASCKAWCIALVSAILVVVADKEKPQYALLAFIPTILFWALDIYYLVLEKMFRESYNLFIDKLHHGKVVAVDLYVVSPKGSMAMAIREAILSFSIWPFYLTLLGMIWIIKTIVF